MKKKLVTVLLASSMVATMLAGCGSGSGDGTEKGSSAKGGDGSVYMLNFKPETDRHGRILQRSTQMRQAYRLQ